MTRIVWSEQSQADLKAIRAYIACDSPVYARRVAQRIKEAVETVSLSPKSAARAPEWDRDDLREIFVHSYRIIFRVQGDTVEGPC
jgi:plasmid stabilization system protein ParE